MPKVRSLIRHAKQLPLRNYRFEAFVPEAQRQFGYYVLPVLAGEQLIGRIDAKFQRARRTLEVRRVFWEPTIKVTKLRQKRLSEALGRLANLIGAERIESN